MRKIMLTALIAAALALYAGPGRTGPGFSAANVHGSYATTVHGSNDGTGVLTADGAGNITSGSETVDDGLGNVCAGTITGSYTVSPDGTGTLTIVFTTTTTLAGACPASPVTNHAAIALVSTRQIEVSGTDAGILESGSLTRQQFPESD